MKRIFAIVACFLLLGCRSVPVSETIAQGAKETISVAYDSLPKECKTKEARRIMETAKVQIDSIIQSCKTEKDAINNKLLRYKLICYALGFVLLFLLWRKIKK